MFGFTEFVKPRRCPGRSPRPRRRSPRARPTRAESGGTVRLRASGAFGVVGEHDDESRIGARRGAIEPAPPLDESTRSPDLRSRSWSRPEVESSRLGGGRIRGNNRPQSRDSQGFDGPSAGRRIRLGRILRTAPKIPSLRRAAVPGRLRDPEARGALRPGDRKTAAFTGPASRRSPPAWAFGRGWPGGRRSSGSSSGRRFRGDLGQGGEDEPAEGEPRVGSSTVGVEEPQSVEQDVQVERPLAPADDPDPTRLVLDFLEFSPERGVEVVSSRPRRSGTAPGRVARRRAGSRGRS